MRNEIKARTEYMARVAASVAEGARLDEPSDHDLRCSRILRGCCPAHGTPIHCGAFDALCPACEAEQN